MEMHEIIARIGELHEQCIDNRPTQLMLVEEIRTKFTPYDQAPKRIELSLKNHYSHKMLKKTFAYIGYKTTKRPCCQSLRIWLME